MLKKIVLLGAGRSSSFLVKYLYNNKLDLGISLHIISDTKSKFLDKYDDINYNYLDIKNDKKLKLKLKNSFLVISLLPPSFHYGIAKTCSELAINMITASYLNDDIKSLETSFIKNKSFLFMEMGLDPGIDHMSAMRIIDRLKKDSEILEFESYTGGLIDESNKKNPWGYKFTWNPLNVVLAGIDNARYIKNGKIKFVPYQKVFKDIKTINFPLKDYEGYPNRDSVKYEELYKLKNLKTLRRGTLRNIGFCNSWDLLVNLGLTDNMKIISNINNMSYFDFFNSKIKAKNKKELNLILEKEYGIKINSREYTNLKWSGFFSRKKVKLKKGTKSDILLEILNDKWKLDSKDVDIIVMVHLFTYKRRNQLKKITSFLQVRGDDIINTAMSKTVGMPIALLVEFIIKTNYCEPGIHLPFKKNIYDYILKKMKNLGVEFNEIDTNI